MKVPSTVFIVNDDPIIRDSLRWLVESINLPAEAYGSAQEFLDSYRSGRPGCLVLDVYLRSAGGLEALERLVQKGRELPVIVLTAQVDVSTAVRALKAGAFDFIEKPFNSRALVERIRQAVEWDASSRQKQQEADDARRRLRSLTPRERQVLRLLVEGNASKRIAERLAIRLRTVEAHRAHIMAKFSAENVADLVRLTLLLGTLEPVSHPMPVRAGRSAFPAQPRAACRLESVYATC
jgi:FixJ family two-component response regulator